MARSMWNGMLAFAAVSVPVKVFSATRPQTPRFRELHASDMGPVGHRMIDADGNPVASEQIVRGFEAEPGEYVVIDDPRLTAAAAPKRKAIDIERFVPRADIDPVFYDRAYLLGPGEAGDDAYAVLAAALERTGRVGLGRVTLRSREQLVALESSGGVLRMHTLHPAADIVSTKPHVPKAKAPSAREASMARMLIEQLQAPFDHEAHHDAYRERVIELARAKAAGRDLELPAAPEPKASGDLLAALEASLEAAGDAKPKGRRSKPAGRKAPRKKAGAR